MTYGGCGGFASTACQLRWITADFFQDVLGDGVALRMDPGAVERVITVDDLEEARRLDVRGISDSRNGLQLFPIAERAVLLAILVDATGRQLIQPRHVSQQRGAGRIDIDADVVDARFHDGIQRRAQVFAFHVVLIESNSDAGGVDLDQFRQRIQCATADGHRSADRGIALGQFFASDLAGRIDAGPRFVDDQVSHFAVGQFAAQDFRHELFGFSASRAVAEGDDAQIVLSDLFRHPLPRLLHSVGRADHVNQGMIQQIAELVQHGQLAAAAESGIDGHHSMSPQRRLQQQLAQVLCEDLHRVGFRTLRQFSPDLPFDAGDNQTRQGIVQSAAEQLGVRVAFLNHQLLGGLLQRIQVELDLHAQDFAAFPPIHGQHAIVRQSFQRLGVIEVILEGLFEFLAFAMSRFTPFAPAFFGQRQPRGLAGERPCAPQL